MSFRGGNRGGGWRGGRGGSREAHKPPPAKKVRTEVRTHYMILRILNFLFAIVFSRIKSKCQLYLHFVMYFDN